MQSRINCCASLKEGRLKKLWPVAQIKPASGICEHRIRECDERFNTRYGCDDHFLDSRPL